MAAVVEHGASIAVLEEKMLVELQVGNTYEALQYVQSFIARKKKSIEPILVSDMVFHAAKLLEDHNAAPYAGTLLLWYMEGGAGEENKFRIERGSVEGSFCDLNRLAKLLAENSKEKSAAVLEVTQKNVLVLLEELPPVGSDSLGSRVQALLEICSSLFEFSSNWRMAYKCRLRLGDMVALARTLDLWSADAYPTERPLFFARSIFHILVNDDPRKAVELLQAANEYVVENGYPTLIAWHFAQITCELLEMPAGDANKASIYEALTKKYYDRIVKMDDKLGPLLLKIGIQCFGCKPPNTGMNPLAMLEALAGGKKAPDGSLDMSNIMSLISGMPGGGKKR
jgi:hypothetical protein